MTDKKHDGWPKLVEITALLECSVVIYANSEEDALREVEDWDEAFAEIGCIRGAKNIDVFDVREGTADDADIDLSKTKGDDNE